MNTLARHLEVIVDPTFDDFFRDRGSVRLAQEALRGDDPEAATAKAG